MYGVWVDLVFYVMNRTTCTWGTSKFVNPIWCWNRNKCGKWGQFHGCWCHQVICSHSIDCVRQVSPCVHEQWFPLLTISVLGNKWKAWMVVPWHLMIYEVWNFWWPKELLSSALCRWCPDVETLSTSLALCDGNPLMTGGLPSQRASNVELWCFPIWLAGMSCWTNSRVATDLRCRDIIDHCNEHLWTRWWLCMS